MIIPRNTIIAIADGEKLNLFRNTGTDQELSLTAVPADDMDSDVKSGSTGREGSSANPDGGQAEEDGFAKGVVELLNQRVLDGKVSNVVVIAAPRTLGEMRKHYHKKLSDVLLGEIAKDLTGHSVADVEKTLAAA